MLEEGRSAVSSSLSEEPTPFLAFRVDLAQSWLGRMGLLASFPASASAPQQQQGVVSTPLAASQLEPVCRSREDANLGGKEEQQQPCVCVLEIRSDEGGGDCGGSGMEIEHRSTDVPLLVGRSRQPQLLWQLLKGEYNAVSREHFEIRPIRRDPQGPTEGDARLYAFKLKCLSCNGITLIEGGGGGGGEKPKKHFLSQNDAEVEVYHGDELAIAGLIRFLFIDCINPPASAVGRLVCGHSLHAF
ncbi:hypothetical protein Pmar_PMAR005756 [Perkinsus marinus ATCC 50983]|uniref:FHA domain-containing protein n=1 Tax=Perkinsus marinus (strain ATCC 50983 / TXsc) TaxID=423536 RepID=C5KE23_PERM5|nr:hypothetical protein Pmar_PMAR005756 [Perkinsus marinus ATCC 50983]EER17235.1 hypothetical protein Pmar_PMAR005756 [Perkinsus marinus ATCC 50983]|eukprot:XP_002785439.1 hypothetical protein Pmar_PMAR005756 [Perkinsus marinus ATCC 50983]